MATTYLNKLLHAESIASHHELRRICSQYHYSFQQRIAPSCMLSFVCCGQGWKWVLH